MMTYTIKAIDTGDNAKDVEFLKTEFKRIVNECKDSKENNYEVVVDYGGKITLASGIEVPCIKTWTKTEINKWLEGFKDE